MLGRGMIIYRALPAFLSQRIEAIKSNELKIIVLHRLENTGKQTL